MENHPIENLMKTTMESIKEMVDANTIVGNPVASPDGSLILPISRVSFGFASGGSEFNSNQANENKHDYPFGGGSGAGVSVKPVAFIVIKNDSVKLLSIEHANTYEKMLDSIPQIVDTIKDMMKSNRPCETKGDGTRGPAKVKTMSNEV